MSDTREDETHVVESIPLNGNTGVDEIPRIESVPPISGSMDKARITTAGLIMCYITIGLIGLVSIALIVYFYKATNSLELTIGTPTTDTIQIYKDARAAITDDIIKIGDRFLGSILLPILTLLIGYMFGSRKENSGE